jgi:uncharacterized membrane protein YgaE (UPF0421/DUF939 family)
MQNNKVIKRPFLFFQDIEFERIIHSIKTALACLAGLLLIHYGIMDSWLLISIAVVMCAQVNVGSVLIKSYMRFLGTLSGSILAAVTITLFGTEIAPTAFTIAVSAMVFSYIATSEKSYSDSGTLGAVTVIVILLGSHPTITTALMRFIDISVGILIAALVSQFVLPIRARDHMRKTQAETIERIRDFYYETLMMEQSDEVVARYQDIDENIVKSLSAQRSLSKEARREPFGVAFDRDKFTQILRCEKEVFRSIVCMHYAYEMMPSGKDLIAVLPAVQDFHLSMCDAFEKISICIKRGDFRHTLVTIPSLQPIKLALMRMSREFSSDDLVYVDGFLFCAEILIIHLTELVILLEQSKKAEPE